MKKVLKIGITIILAVIIIAVLFLGYLTLTEYKPTDVEVIEIDSNTIDSLSPELLKTGEEITVLTWNTGYAGLGKNSDFVMDGGGKAPAPDEEQVNVYFEGIKDALAEYDADIELLQEVDLKSSRTFKYNQMLDYNLGEGVYARNYKCDYVPFPWPPIGNIDSGIYTTTAYDIEDAYRYSLPCPFSWPLKIANLKRCMTASYLPVEGTDKELVVVNFHLEAYDSGEGKAQQTKQLMEFIRSEYEKGNWVIAGGDWNQTFPGGTDAYPNRHEDLWAVGSLNNSDVAEDFSLVYDLSSPTCRLLNQPYDPEDFENTQYYVIDGFVISKNVELVSVETQNLDFENSDHNPVLMRVVLGD